MTKAGLLIALLAMQTAFTTHTETVVVPVTVRSREGQPLRGLAASDFRLTVDGTPQPITVFQEGGGPASLGVLLDYSQSMQGKVPSLVSSVQALTAHALPEDDWLLTAFAEQIVLAASGGEATEASGRFVASLRGTLPAGPTALYDHLFDALEALRAARWERKALIVISDGGDNASRRGYDEVRRFARSSGVAVFATGLRGLPPDTKAEARISRLATDSGGSARFVSNPDDLAGVIDAFARTLRAQYILGFPAQPRSGSGERRIRVNVIGPGRDRVTIGARRSY